MTWELGGGYGHLAPLLSLARPLQDAGHTLMFAARDLSAAEAVLGASNVPYYQAPANFFPKQAVKLHSYPQILLQTAFNDADELLARVRAWRALYTLLEPDILVCDHSPTALLAARGLSLRCVATGNGFVIPPDVTPLPELRAWQAAPREELERDEARALDMANAVARALGAAPLPRFAALFAEVSHALFTLPELDNYAELRQGAEYWGVPPGPAQAAPRWSEGGGKRVFLYGQPFAGLPEALADLERGGYRALVCMPKVPAEERARLQTTRICFSEGLLDLDAVSRDCDCALMTNGHGTTTAMLLAGKPMLLLPQHLEMLLIADQVEKQGAGLKALPQEPETVRAKLTRVLEDENFAKAARKVAERHRGKLSPEGARRSFATLIDRLASEGA